MSKQALILVAGCSRRLQKLTNQPKCLLQFGEKKLVDIQVENLIRNDYKNIIFIVGYKADKIIRYINFKYPKNTFKFIKNPYWNKTNVLGSLYFARDLLTKETVILHGDTLFHESLLTLLVDPLNGAELVVQKKECQEEEMKYLCDKDNNIIFLSKKINPSKSEGEFIGISLLSKVFCKKITKILNGNPYKLFCNEYYEWVLLQVNSLYKLPLLKIDATHVPMIEIDFPKDYKDAKRIFKEHF